MRRGILDTYADALLSIISQRVCLVCEQERQVVFAMLCRSCARELLRMRLAAPVAAPAFVEGAPVERLAGVWSAARYGGLVRELVLGCKFHRRMHCLYALESLAAQCCRHVLRAGFRPDVVVPVPAPLRRRLYRGTDLPGWLACALGARFRLRVSRALRRVGRAGRQVRRRRRHRLDLAAGAFAVKRFEAVAGARVLLVDDVLTTGATARVCVTALLAAGALRVGVLVLAHG